MTITVGIFIPFLAAALIPLVYKRLSNKYIGWLVLIVPLVLFIGLIKYIPLVSSGKQFDHTIPWIPSLGIYFTTYLDGLSLIFGLLITGIGTLVILYSIYYLHEREALGRFYAYLLMFMGAMLGVVFSDNILVLYVFWELTSISSFLLIAFWYHRKQSRYGAQKSILITVSGGVSMLAGFIMLSVMANSFSVRDLLALSGELSDHSLFIPAMILLLLGALTKSAQFPFHIWLPDAMEAPTPVSAYLHSATMVKAGIYLIARFTPVFGGEELWLYIISGVGLLTLLWGSFNAVKQTDLKALLAYSTVSQLGLIMSLIGVGSAALKAGTDLEPIIYTQATFAAMFHLINHSTFKGALFMVVGIVDHNLGTRDIRRLGGLISLMPVSFTIALIGSFSMAGLPPFNGFLSKEMFFEAMLNVRQSDLFSIGSWGVIAPLIAWVASLFTFVYCMIIVFRTFLGKHQHDKIERKVQEGTLGILIAPSVLAILVVGIFFYPNLVGKYLLQPAMISIYPQYSGLDGLTPHITAWHGVNNALLMTISVVILGGLMYKFLRYWQGLYTIPPFRWSIDTLYNSVLVQTENVSSRVTKTYMTGRLRDYLIYIFLFFLITVGGGWLLADGIEINFANDAPISTYELLIILAMMIAGISIIFAKSRITAILLNGVLGYSIAILFVFFRAPDLALTQTVVESVTTALFLLCFYFLPEWKKITSTPPRKTKLLNALIAITIGTVVTIIALIVQGNKMFESIAFYFEDAYRLAGGRNIVNTILGDFRAFDTMLEVVVLFIAGLGVYTLIRLKSEKGDKAVEDQ